MSIIRDVEDSVLDELNSDLEEQAEVTNNSGREDIQ